MTESRVTAISFLAALGAGIAVAVICSFLVPEPFARMGAMIFLIPVVAAIVVRRVVSAKLKASSGLSGYPPHWQVFVGALAIGFAIVVTFSIMDVVLGKR